MSGIELFRRIRCELSKIVLKITYPKRFCYGKNFYYRKGFFANVSKSGYVSVGNSVFFNNYCSINCHERVVIEDGCTFGEGVRLYDHDHDFRGLKNGIGEPYVTAPICIGRGCWLGSGVIVLKGVTIGEGSVIAAGTVVTKDIPKASLVYQERNLVIKPL